MSDVLAARLRTAWPLFVGHVAAVLVALVLRWTGVQLDSVVVLELVSLGLSWAVWEAGRWLERRTSPVLAGVGRWLIAAGRDVGAPTYPDSRVWSPPTQQPPQLR